MAGAAVGVGVSEAIGAFLAGSLVAETRHKERAERLFAPLQGLFAAVFFLSFGLSVDIRTLGAVVPAALLISLFAIVAKIATGVWNGRAEGLGPQSSLILGLSLLPRGEFSIVLAALAAQAGYMEAPALITLTVLILAVVGTIALRNAPQLSARMVRIPGLGGRPMRA
jgi:CPA2 family monovalent cation:H+ antiporter-2